MLKKILMLFKRDKSSFSNNELCEQLNTADALMALGLVIIIILICTWAPYLLLGVKRPVHIIISLLLILLSITCIVFTIRSYVRIQEQFIKNEQKR
jgi:uncharacterized Tic20 family protein